MGFDLRDDRLSHRALQGSAAADSRAHRRLGRRFPRAARADARRHARPMCCIPGARNCSPTCRRSSDCATCQTQPSWDVLRDYRQSFERFGALRAARVADARGNRPEIAGCWRRSVPASARRCCYCNGPERRLRFWRCSRCVGLTRLVELRISRRHQRDLARRGIGQAFRPAVSAGWWRCTRCAGRRGD